MPNNSPPPHLPSPSKRTRKEKRGKCQSQVVVPGFTGFYRRLGDSGWYRVFTELDIKIVARRGGPSPAPSESLSRNFSKGKTSKEKKIKKRQTKPKPVGGKLRKTKEQAGVRGPRDDVAAPARRRKSSEQKEKPKKTRRVRPGETSAESNGVRR